MKSIVPPKSMRGPKSIAPLLREPHDEGRARANWERIQERRKTPVRLWSGLGLTFAVASVAVLAWLVVGPQAPSSLARADGSACSGPITEDRVEFADRSRVVLDPFTELEVLENDGERMRMWMRQGAADFDVTPGGPRRWSIETGLVSVEVLGTSFRVERREHSVHVSVTRGTVLVRGPTTPDGLVRLVAGEEVTVAADVSAPEPSASIADLPEITAANTASNIAATEPAPVAEEAATATRAHDAPRTLENTAENTANSIENSIENTAENTANSIENATELAAEAEEGEVALPTLADADALRRAGRIDDARTVLRGIADDPSAGPGAALAAFTLGRLEHDQHHPRAAADAFAQAIALGLPEPLIEDARARRVQSFAALGDEAGLEVAGRDYLEHHPSGRRRPEVERWLAAP